MWLIQVQRSMLLKTASDQVQLAYNGFRIMQSVSSSSSLNLLRHQRLHLPSIGLSMCSHHADRHPQPQSDVLHAHPAQTSPTQQGQGYFARTLCCTTGLTLQLSDVLLLGYYYSTTTNSLPFFFFCAFKL